MRFKYKADGHESLIAVGHGMDAQPYIGQGTAKTTVFVMRSDDGGQSFRYLSRVPCSDEMEFCRCPCISGGLCLPAHQCNASHPSDAIGGPAEPTIAQLKNGDFLLLFRVTGRPCMATTSSDLKTWSTPRETPIWSVWPELLVLPNGVLVATSGRPSLGLWHSADGLGQSWTFVNLARRHNALLPDQPDAHFNAATTRCSDIFCPDPAGGPTDAADPWETSTSYTGATVLHSDRTPRRCWSPTTG